MKHKILNAAATTALATLLTVGAVFAATTVGTNVDTGGTLNVSGATTLGSTLAVTGTTTLTGALTANGDVTLGNANSDVVNVYGVVRTKDAAGNWADITDVATFGTRGWIAAYDLKTSWGTSPASSFETMLANTQVSVADGGSGKTIVGFEGKATANGVNLAASTLTGVLGQVVSKTAGVALGTGIGVSSNLDIVDATTPVTTWYNYNANITGSTNPADLGTATILGVATAPSQAWDYGIDFNAAPAFNTADIRLANGEIISNATDGTIAFGTANLTNTGNITVSSGYINAPSYQVGQGAAITSSTAPTKSSFQQASYWPVVTSGGDVDIDLIAMDQVDVGRHLLFSITTGTSALTVTAGDGMTIVQVAAIAANTAANAVGDAIDCLITTTATAYCTTYASN